MHKCIKYKVYNTNISGAAHINVTKREQIWLPHEEYLGYAKYYPLHHKPLNHWNYTSYI